MEWQPIETAPKDGTKIIGLCGGLCFTMAIHDYYDKWPHEEGGPTFRKEWTKEMTDSFCPCSPTHWMPLPAPPSAPTGKK